MLKMLSGDKKSHVGPLPDSSILKRRRSLRTQSLKRNRATDILDGAEHNGVHLLAQPRAASLSNNNNALNIDLTIDSGDELECRQSVYRFHVGDLVTTPYGDGSVQGIYTRRRSDLEVTIIRRVKIPVDRTKWGLTTIWNPDERLWGIQVNKITNILVAESEIVIVDDLEEPLGSSRDGLWNGDIITHIDGVGFDNEEHVKTIIQDLNSNLFASNKQYVDLKLLRISQSGSESGLTIYEVWLQWGDGCYFHEFKGQNSSTVKRRAPKQTFCSCWMPKAFVQEGNVRLASERVAFKHKVGRPFGCYTNSEHEILITKDAVCRIWPGMYLSDTTLDFWLSTVLNRVPEELFGRVYIFNTLFFSWMAACADRREDFADFKSVYARVASTTTKVNIFRKDMLFMPVNDGLHWSIAVICNPGFLGSAVKDSQSESLGNGTQNSTKNEPQSTQFLGATSEKTLPKRVSIESPQDVANGDIREQIMENNNFNLSKRRADDPLKGSIKMSPGPKVFESRQAFPKGAFKANRKNRRRVMHKQKPTNLHQTSNSCTSPILQPTPTIILLDSVRGNNSRRIMSLIRSFLEEEWNSRMSPALVGEVTPKAVPGFSPQVPVQYNNCDCGVFLLEFFERLLLTNSEQFLKFVEQKVPATISQLRHNFQNLMGGRSWFQPIDVARKRWEISNAIRLYSRNSE